MKFTLILSACLFLSAHSQTYNYYYGNLHSHTGFSDGSKDSASTGISKPSGAYTYANASQNFDFLGVSEHNHYSASHNPGFKLPLYQSGLTMANTANQDGTFLALFGMEYGVSSDYNGHVVIYGFNQLIGWENSVPGVTGNNYDIYNAKTDYAGLFRKIKNNPNAFCYLAHPNTNDYTNNGPVSTAIANAPYNAMYDSAIVGVPFRNGLAFSTFTDYSDYPNSDYLSYYKKLLSIGYHIGIGYDHDNHNTTFGRNNAGRLVILAPALTRADLTTAMQKMHFYGSDDWNAKIEFTMNGNIMGSILTGSTSPTFNILHNDGDSEQASVISVWKGKSGGASPTIVHSISQNNTVTYTDNNLAQDVEYYYFIEIKQADGDRIITSPIWYKSSVNIGTQPATAINEQFNDIKFNFFPNPVSKQLNISIAECDHYDISIIDISGRVVLKHNSNDNDLSIDLTDINPGIYTLNISTASTSVSKKLVVE